MRKRFILEFDEEPTLLFIQHKSGDIRQSELYQDGKKVKGMASLRIEAKIDEFTTHSIGLITGKTKGDNHGNKS